MKRSRVEFDDMVVDQLRNKFDNKEVVAQIRNKFDNKEYELALSLITKRINTQKGNEQHQALLIRAEFYCQLKRWPEALNDTQNILQCEPRSVVGLRLHLKCLLKQGKVDEALAALQETISLDPNNTWALKKRAALLIRQDQLDDALVDLSRAIVAQIRNKFDNKECELALSLITKLINTRQGNEQHQALLIRAKFYCQLKRWPEALSDTQNILQREPRSVVGLGLRLECLLKQGKVDEALAALQETISLDLNNTWALEKRAALFIRQDKFDDALVDLSRVIEIDPNHRRALVSRGLLLVKQDKLDEALADFNSVISTPIKDNCFVDALRGAGSIYEHRGHLTEAREHLDRALELVPDNRSVLAQRAALLSKQQSNLEESGHDKAQVLANFASAKSHGGNNFQQAPHFFGAKSSVAQVDTYPPQDDEVNDQDTGTKFAQQPS